MKKQILETLKLNGTLSRDIFVYISTFPIFSKKALYGLFQNTK